MSILSTHSTRISYSALIAVIVCPLHPLFAALHAPRCPAARLPLVAGKAEICRRQPGLEEVGGRWNCSKPEWIRFLFSDTYHCPLSWFPCLCQMQSAGFQAWKNVPLVLMLRQQQKKKGGWGRVSMYSSTSPWILGWGRVSIYSSTFLWILFKKPLYLLWDAFLSCSS